MNPAFLLASLLSVRPAGVAQAVKVQSPSGDLVLTVKSPRLMSYEGSLNRLTPAAWNRALANRVRPFAASHPTEARNTYENYDETSMTLSNDEAHLPSMQLAGSSKVDVALRQNLDIVDKFIVDCEQRVKEQPGDELARDYLSGAYQQKAELLSVMMEREGGVY